MNAIEVVDLRKEYRSRGQAPVRALDGVSFAVPSGRIHALLGPNGAGKSTIVKILGTITTATSGSAAVMGFDVGRQPLEARRRMAVVLQQTAAETLLTVRDNLLIYARLHGIPRREAVRRVVAVAEEFDLASRLRDVVQDLSLGTKRRIQVAKIFLLDAPVVVLDEATTGMDPIMKRQVMDRLRHEARRGRTILLTTQVLSEAEELADHIVILDRGRTMAAGSLAELRTRASRTFRVSLAFAEAGDGLGRRLEALAPEALALDGALAELTFRGAEEAAILAQLAELSRERRVLRFEVRGPTLEEIFLELVREVR